jgi:hypothetical protein
MASSRQPVATHGKQFWLDFALFAPSRVAARRGEQQLERAAQAQRDAEDEPFAGLSEAQRNQLRRLLLVLRAQLIPEHNAARASFGPEEST